MIDLTDAAISKAIEKTKYRSNRDIRIGIAPSGCAGFEYIIEFADTITKRDLVIDYGKFGIVIDKDSKEFFKGAKLDWVEDGFNESFKIINPNEEYSCGCGSSVTFKQGKK